MEYIRISVKKIISHYRKAKYNIMFITVCVIAYNEEKNIKSILRDILNQDYNHNNIEVLLVDSASTDSTKKIMQEFADKNKANSGVLHFADVKVLDNPKKILPCGWNVVLKEYKGEAILKVDAHAHIPPDFVTKNVNTLKSGEDICGGQRPVVCEDATKWQDTLLLAESSMFGSSIAPYRNNPGKSYVKSMFHAAYRRKVFEKTGLFNENLARTEDNEMHYRMRKAGFKLCFNPDIISYQYIRSSLSKMLKQKYGNGYWVALTMGVCPECLSLYHFVPFAFLAAIILSTVLCLVFGSIAAITLIPGIVIAKNVIYCLTAIMWGMYWLLAIVMSVAAVVTAGKKRNITCIALPVLFFLLHICYGAGTLVGMIRMPSWLKGINNGRNKER